MKINISETTERQLDWLVAKCEGYFDTHNNNGLVIGIVESGWVWVAIHPNAWRRSDYLRFSPSTDWSQGGPIADRERIERYGRSNNQWGANVERKDKAYYGPSSLFAAMRCYVASKLGDEVEIPEELK